jgi:transcription elongation GreA/GreB family factor
LNKQLLIQKIIASLAAGLEGYARSAQAAHAEATDEQSKAENKYDTRGLEASYLARGQSRQAAEVMQAIAQYESLVAQPFSPKEPIDLGAVVELERAGERTAYFIGPSAGGTEIECDGELVLVITPQSPLGQQLIGRRQGDRLELTIGRSRDRSRIVGVS